MRVEHYSDYYREDVVNIIEEFHRDYLTGYYGSSQKEIINNTISSFEGERAKNSFLLIIDGHCVGLLAGLEINSLLNTERFFQEIIWYVKKPFGRFAFYLIKQAKIMLKSYGFSNIIMAVIENSKARRVEKIYESLGFNRLETHYIISL